MRARRAPEPAVASINTATVAPGGLERKVADTVQYLTQQYLTQLHLGNMDADDFAQLKLRVDFVRDTYTGNGASLIVQVGE